MAMSGTTFSSKMKTISVTSPGNIEIIDTATPTPGPYQALVKTEYACLCNSTDSELVHGRFPGMEEAFPFALGHESVGTVVQTGDKVRSFSPGQRAIGGLVFDFENLATGWGGFCEYTLANDHAAMIEDGIANEENGWFEVFEIQTPLPNDIPPEDAVLLCTWREVLGAFRDFHLKQGDKVLIFGAGPVGLSFVKLGKLFGLGWIGIVDRHPGKQAKALEFGADAVFDRDAPAIAGLKNLDAVIDAVGKTELINTGLPLLKRGGSLCIYGVLAGLKDFTIDNSLGDFNYNIFMHQWPTRLYEKDAQEQLCEWMRQGQLLASDFITHRFPIDQITQALEAVRSRKVIKALLSY